MDGRTLNLPLLLVTTVALSALTSCGGCGGKKKSRDTPAGVTETPTPEPSPVIDESVGEEVPPITPDGVATIDTENGAAVKHLVFETTPTTEVGRYLSEYLMVIRSNEKSCVRLKVRPTAGITEQVDDEAAQGDIQGGEACAGQVVAEPTPEATAAPTEAPAASLREAGLALARYTTDEGLVWATPENRRARGFQLAPATAAICAPRLFRMEQTSLNNVEPVVSKIGLLRVVGSKVRIWLDEEYHASCSPATGAGQVVGRTIPFGPLIQDGNVSADWRDALYLDHLINLAAELDKVVTAEQAHYGSISDIDDSGYVEVFISPDVNRARFVTGPTEEIDKFDADLIYKPQDLAFYDAKINPVSNEGEILYLWAPDPAGIYSAEQFPSANSLTSNYAKGYAASQAMTLIIANQRLLVQKQKGIPDPWLVQSLALLASGYFGGNDYMWHLLAEYLTSRHHYISLVNGADPTLITEKYKLLGYREALGMRGMFGWYLHSKMCSATSVAPCDALLSLVTSTKNGIPAVEDLTGLAFKDLTANFGLSVGISLVDDPAKALAFFNVDPLPAGTPPKPTLLPDLLEISAAAPPVTVETRNTAGGLVTTDATDRTITGPFPSKKMLVFQTIAADNDMEFKLTDNSVAYILVTGLIENKTDVTAYFGKGLNVVFIPLGERNGNLRRLHVEKLSEIAHADYRPENLTQTVDPDKTYMVEPAYPGVDYMVTPSREIWTLGSIDNHTINVQGTATTVSDSDTYEIEFAPCEGLSGASLSACQATTHLAIVQVYIRDFDKELAPMLLVTEPDRKIFRGHSLYGRVKKWDTELQEADHWTLCQSAQSWPDLPLALTNGQSAITVLGGGAHGLTAGQEVQFFATDGIYTNGALRNYPYTVSVVDATTFRLVDPSGATVTFTGTFPSTYFVSTGAKDECASGGVAAHPVFDHDLTAADPLAFAHNYDNFLSMGAYGYPFSTRNTLYWEDLPDCGGPYCYLQEESSRQHLHFAMSSKTPIYELEFYAGPRGIASDMTMLTPDEIGALTAIKARMDAGGADPDPSNAFDAAFVEDCASVAGLTTDQCAVVVSQKATIQSKIKGWLASEKKGVLCRPGSDCTAEMALFTAGPTALTTAWLATDKHFWYEPTTYKSTTYYRSIEPINRDTYCGGDAATGNGYGTCSIKPPVDPVIDIRSQLNVETSDIRNWCYRYVLGANVRVCIDHLSANLLLVPELIYGATTLPHYYPTDRNVIIPPSDANGRRIASIATRGGEIIAKPERIHAVVVRVPGSQATTIANVIVGGRNLSQGKYLLRARIFKP